MPTQVVNKSLPVYPLNELELNHGQIYEGSDGLLYVGCSVRDILAVGINHDAYINYESNGEVIHFREVDAIVNYQ